MTQGSWLLTHGQGGSACPQSPEVLTVFFVLAEVRSPLFSMGNYDCYLFVFVTFQSKENTTESWLLAGWLAGWPAGWLLTGWVLAEWLAAAWLATGWLGGWLADRPINVFINRLITLITD